MKNTKLPKTLPRFIWHFIKPYKFVAILYVFMLVAAGFWGPLNSLLIKELINRLSTLQPGVTSPLFWPAAFIVLNFIIFDNVTWRTVGYIDYKYQLVIKNKIERELLALTLEHSHQFFLDRLSGRISSQIAIVAESIESIIFINGIHNLIRGASLLLVSLATTYYVHPLFFAVLFVWITLFSLVSLGLSRRLIQLSDRYAGSTSATSGQIVDCITNQTTVRTFAHKTYELTRLDTFLTDRLKAFQDKEFLVLTLYWTQGLMIAAMLGFSCYFLVFLYEKGLVTQGDFALILGLALHLGDTVWWTMNQVNNVNKAIGACKQGLAGLIVTPEIVEKKDALDLVVKKGAITFESVEFSYRDMPALFANTSVTINGGEKVGLVGYSGSGKSTFVNLILRLYDVTNGRITLDGQDIRSVTQNSLRAAIALIPQDPTLFHRSLIDNIRYGKLDASDEEVIAAAQKAQADQFITTLPLGYNALVGDRGVKLSGGQRQRIAIARAILKDAPLLVLDEATSQLDSLTEQEIQENLWDLMKGKTTIVIAHRLSTILHMDRILVFDAGKIVEDGTHEALLNQNGIYTRLWNAQHDGFLPDKEHYEGAHL